MVKQVQAAAAAAVWKLCVIHRQCVTSKKITKELRAVLDEAVKLVNLIKSRTMNSRLFSILSNEMDAYFQQLLLHSKVRWLSPRKGPHPLVCF